MTIFPIFSNNLILGHYPSWWRSKVCSYKYLLGQGEFFLGEIESLFTYAGSGIIVIIGIEKYTGWLAPWYYAPLLVLLLRIIKVGIGKIDRDYLKMGQAMQEYTVRARLTPMGNEQLDRLKNIEKAVSPNTFREIHTTYVEETK